MSAFVVSQIEELRGPPAPWYSCCKRTSAVFTVLITYTLRRVTVYFTWFYAKSSAVKETEFDYLYSADYRNWIEEAKTAYDELNAVQSNLRTQVIKDHQLLETGVYQTTYEDGTAVVVNYNDYTVDVGGIAVEPMGYLTGGESN